MNQLARGLFAWTPLLWIASGVGCGGKVDGAPNDLMLAPAQESTQMATCGDIHDFRTCVYHHCLWGGPDSCDGHSLPPGDVEHVSTGGCFSATACSEDAQCGAGTQCAYLAYAPCYFTPDGDGPQCTAYESQICTYLHACVPLLR